MLQMCKDLNLVTAVLKETVIFLSTLQDKKLSVYDQAAKPSVENRNKCLDFFALRPLLSKPGGSSLSNKYSERKFQFVRLCRLLNARELFDNARFSELNIKNIM